MVVRVTSCTHRWAVHFQLGVIKQAVQHDRPRIYRSDLQFAQQQMLGMLQRQQLNGYKLQYVLADHLDWHEIWLKQQE